MPVDLKTLLGDVIKNNASDLHIRVGSPPAMRIEGVLHYLGDAGVFTHDDVELAFQTVLTSSLMEKYKRENELDFSFAYRAADGAEVRFRGSTYFALRKMAGTFRMIPMNVPSIDDLGLPVVLKEVCKRRRGLFLVAGPTGHGKSTTLAAMINEINTTRYDHIITIEDPVEFVYKSDKCLINQREVGSDTLSFPEGLRRALRHDPDVLLIGELRDLETISTAITASETGHFVLSTLHTQDAAQSIDRLIDVFPPSQQGQVRVQLATALVGICSQQLVPKESDFGGGRMCVTEVLLANPAVKNCIREGKINQIRTLIQTGMTAGMHTMEQSLANLTKNGILAEEVAMSFAYDPKELQRILHPTQKVE